MSDDQYFTAKTSRDAATDAATFDRFVNGGPSEIVTNRYGVQYPTSRGELEGLEQSATAARDQAIAAASVSGDFEYHLTKASADSALSGYADGQVVEVAKDESTGGARTRYVKTGSVWSDPVVLSSATEFTFDTLAEADSFADAAAVGTPIRTTGRDTPGDGGGFASVVEAFDDSTYPDGGKLRPVNTPVSPLMWGTSGAAIASALTFGPTQLPASTITTTTDIVSTEPAPLLAGQGWRRDPTAGTYSGSVIEGTTATTDLLTLQSASPDSGTATDLHGMVVRDLALIHRGSGAALTIDNLVRARIDNISIDCDDGAGAIGLELDNFAFFVTMRGSAVRQFSDVGILVTGDGSERTFEDCHVTSNIASAAYGLDIQQSGVTIKGGQLNLPTGGTFQDPAPAAPVGGWAARFYQGEANVRSGRSVVQDLLIEKGNGIIVDAVAGGRYDNVAIVRPRINHSNANVAPLAYFGNTKGSVVHHPEVNSDQQDATIIQFGPGSIDCGMVCDSEVAKLRVVADAAATRPFIRVTGRTEWAHVAPDGPNNVLYDYEHVEELGPVSRGADGVWSKYLWSIQDDKHVTKGNIGAGEYLIWSDQMATAWVKFMIKPGTNHTIERIATGTDALTFIASGTLNGTTGTDGQLSVQYSRSIEALYIENRTGATRTFKMARISHA